MALDSLSPVQRREFLQRLSILSAAIVGGCASGTGLLPGPGGASDTSDAMPQGVSKTVDAKGNTVIRDATSGYTYNVSTSGSTVSMTATDSSGKVTPIITSTLASGVLTFESAQMPAYEFNMNAPPTGTFTVVGHTITPVSEYYGTVSGSTVNGSMALTPGTEYTSAVLVNGAQLTESAKLGTSPGGGTGGGGKPLTVIGSLSRRVHPDSIFPEWVGQTLALATLALAAFCLILAIIEASSLAVAAGVLAFLFAILALIAAFL